ncbi:MAG: hypothetical protein RLZZ631_122 [Cyanobacteriota bacterium]
MIPLLLAATPLPVQTAAPNQAAADLSTPLSENFGQQAPVQTFDPVLRAADLAVQMPRQWSGTYQPFSATTPVTVQLSLGSATAIGQMVDVRGEITVGSTTLPVQGNYNAKSDQLDLLVLGNVESAGLEDGGEFLGLQGFNLAGWQAPRLTNPGGELVLNPVGSSGAPAVRGLW